MKLFITLFLFFTFSLSLVAQTTIHGRIIDSETKETLAFANILTSKTRGVISDAEGNFHIEIKNNQTQFEVSYIGYKKQTIQFSPNKSYYLIELEPAVESLETVVISGKYVNPAIALMQRIIKAKSKNDYRKKLRKYSFIKYYKFLVSTHPDSIDGKIDSVYYNGKFAKIDSSQYKFKEAFKEKDLFVMESVMKVNATLGVEKNKVIASKTAGFKNPMYEMLALQVSNQNVYDDQYKFLIQSYLGPLTSLSLKQYKYEITDSIQIQNRAIYVISYLNTKKPLISGKIFVDKQSLAVAKMTLNTFKQFELQTTHLFNYYPKYDAWLPFEATMLMKKAKKKDKIELAGGGISFQKKIENDSIRHTNTYNEMDHLFAASKTKFTQVNIGNLHQDKIQYNLQIAPNAHKRSSEFWSQYRDSTRVKRESNTYNYIDSIAEKEDFEGKINKFRKLATGRIPLGFVDFALLKLLDKNEYEGLRISLGGKTNEKVSNKYSLEGYLAYGFKDDELKYQGRFNYKLNHQTQTYTYLAYTKDIKPSASFTTRNEGFLKDALSNLSYDQFYMSKSWIVGASHLFSKSIRTDFKIQKQFVELKHPLPPKFGSFDFPNKDITSLILDLEYEPFSKFFLSPQGRVTLKEGYPKFYLNVEKSIPAFKNGSYKFYRLDFQTKYKKTYLNKHYTNLIAKIGYASANASIIHLYSPQSSGYDYESEKWYQKIHLVSSNSSFKTMQNLEFVDNLVSTVQVKHTFSKIKISENYNFDIRVIGRATWGISYRQNRYAGIRSLEKGYFETGLELNRIFKLFKQGFGVGFYYRLGNYQYENAVDNLFVKLTVTPFKAFNL
ncbi:MAG TPA: carboxypeptidase-like regulatory domain-containing protein [Lutibacter sp.]|nr:carboxypeptidase-like regulatory domain-containing protein [Lutibacter sp.]